MFLEAHAGRNTIVAVPNLGSRASPDRGAINHD